MKLLAVLNINVTDNQVSVQSPCEGYYTDFHIQVMADTLAVFPINVLFGVYDFTVGFISELDAGEETIIEKLDNMIRFLVPDRPDAAGELATPIYSAFTRAKVWVDKGIFPKFQVISQSTGDVVAVIDATFVPKPGAEIIHEMFNEGVNVGDAFNLHQIVAKHDFLLDSIDVLIAGQAATGEGGTIKGEIIHIAQTAGEIQGGRGVEGFGDVLDAGNESDAAEYSVFGNKLMDFSGTAVINNEHMSERTKKTFSRKKGKSRLISAGDVITYVLRLVTGTLLAELAVEMTIYGKVVNSRYNSRKVSMGGSYHLHNDFGRRRLMMAGDTQ